MNALFVGGPLDGEVHDVLDFREGSTPDGYCPVETWGQANGEWHRMDERGMLLGSTHRLEIAFAEGEAWSNARIMESMAKGLGVLFTYSGAGRI